VFLVRTTPASRCSSAPVDTDSAGRLELAVAQVPADRVARRSGRGGESTTAAGPSATRSCAPLQLGILEAALELTRTTTPRSGFVRQADRHRLFQAVTQRLAYASIDFEAVRLTIVAGGLAACLSGLPAEDRGRHASSGPLAVHRSQQHRRCPSTAVGITPTPTRCSTATFVAAKRAEFELGGRHRALLARHRRPPWAARD